MKPIPDGYASVTPYLAIRGAKEAAEFYKKVFGAVEIMCMPGPDGKVGHAEIQIGSSRIMMADEFPQHQCVSPKALGGSPVHIHLYVEDVDAVFAKAVAAGVKVLRPVADQFYGDRSGGFEDPFGHIWHVATRKEDLTPEEIARRAPKG